MYSFTLGTSNSSRSKPCRSFGAGHAAGLHKGKACTKIESNLSKEDMLTLYQQTAQLLGLPKKDWEPFTDCMEGRSIMPAQKLSLHQSLVDVGAYHETSTCESESLHEGGDNDVAYKLSKLGTEAESSANGTNNTDLEVEVLASRFSVAQNLDDILCFLERKLDPNIPSTLTAWTGTTNASIDATASNYKQCRYRDPLPGRDIATSNLIPDPALDSSRHSIPASDTNAPPDSTTRRSQLRDRFSAGIQRLRKRM